MSVIDSISGFHGDMTVWRRDLHAHPETAYEEFRTSGFIASKLEEFGIDVDLGLAVTGVVGTLSRGSGPAIGMRADMDALGIAEANGFAHKSVHEGKMHACGHDGHVAMLLGAARYLAETGSFSGTVHFIFQPAEENEGGGRRMVEEGLFEKFPMDSVFGLHNWPGLEAGRFAVRQGPIMAAVDNFEVVVTGKSAHAAMPGQGADALAAAASMVETIRVFSLDTGNSPNPVVLSVTQFHAGDTWNVIADNAVLRGTVRSFRPEDQDAVDAGLRKIAEDVKSAHGVGVEVSYLRKYPATVNHPDETALAAKAAALVVGPENLDSNPDPSMGGEDFAFMLGRAPGCYMWIGNGSVESGGVLHNPGYDFNDEILPLGASYWARLVEEVLG